MWILSGRRSAFALQATFLSGFCLGVNQPVHVRAADLDLCHAVATPTATPDPAGPSSSPSLLVIRASAQIMTLITELQCDSVRGFSSQT